MIQYSECPGSCQFRIDWLNYPGTTGESMARQDGALRWSCGRYVYIINHMGEPDPPCWIWGNRERQLSLFSEGVS